MYVLLWMVGCYGGMGPVPEIMALLGTYLQFRGHQSPVASGRQALPDHGSYVEEDHEQCTARSQG